jgi:putative endonuclease
MYFVYIIQSEADESYYIGFTENLQKRISDHNSGNTNYTSKKMPWILVYFESFDNKTVALKREKFLKRQKNKDFYQRLINNQDR